MFSSFYFFSRLGEIFDDLDGGPTPPTGNFYVTESATDFYVTEDGLNNYVTET